MRPKHYSPAINRFLVSVLYHEAKGRGMPMTTLANQLLSKALTGGNGWQKVDETRHVLALSHVSLCIGHLATRSRDPTSKALQAFQSARSEHDLGAAFSEHYRSGLAYSTARARNDDDLVFSSLHKILFQTLRSFPAVL